MHPVPRLLPCLALAAGCSLPPATPQEGTSGDLGTVPEGTIALSDEEIAQVARGVFTAVVPSYYYRDQEQFPVKVTGTTGSLPAEIGPFQVVPWDAGSHERAVELRFLEREYDDLVVQVYIRNPVGGPSVYDVLFSRGEQGWTFRRILEATEYL